MDPVRGNIADFQCRFTGHMVFVKNRQRRKKKSPQIGTCGAAAAEPPARNFQRRLA